jgi:hypothetical protein
MGGMEGGRRDDLHGHRNRRTDLPALLTNPQLISTSDLFEKRHGLTPTASPSDDLDDALEEATDVPSGLTSWTAEDSKAIHDRALGNHGPEVKVIVCRRMGDHFEDEEERRQMLGGIRGIFQQGAADRHLEERDG